MISFHVGQTVIVEVTIYDKDGNKFDPGTNVIDVYREDGTKLVDTQAMTKDAVGEYSYDLAKPNIKGIYTAKTTHTAGTKVTIFVDKFVVV